MNINSVWGWLLPILMVGSIVLVVIFVLRYVMRSMSSVNSSSGQAAVALIIEVFPPKTDTDQSAHPAGRDGKAYMLDLEVIVALDYVAQVSRVPYFITSENEQELGLLRSCALIEVKVNPRHNMELYVQKGTLSWDGETDLETMRKKLGIRKEDKKKSGN
jgi:Na+-transporting methylmalonyl-CoA/oxaloacetate decarboxylase gamma subunit